MKKVIAILIVLIISFPLFSGQQKLSKEKENGQSIESYNYPEFNDEYTSERKAELDKICEEVEKETPQDIITYAIIIVGLQPGGVAGKAGLRINDIIYSFNDRAFFDIESKDATQNFIDYVKSLPEGTYPMDIIRYGKAIRLQIKLPSYSGGGPRLGAVLLRLVNKPEAYFEKGISYLESMSSRDDLKKVSWLFETAKMLSPEWADVYYNLGLIYGKLDYYDEAIENLAISMQIMKKNNFQSDKINKVETLITDNRIKKYKLEEIKVGLASGKWDLIQKEPNVPDSYLYRLNNWGEVTIVPSEWIPQFNQDKLGRLFIYNPLGAWGEQEGKIKEKARKKLLSKNPWLPVYFDGRYFEVRSFYLCETYLNDVSMWCPVPYLLKGEINFEYSEPIIRIRVFADRGLKEKAYCDRDFNKAFDRSQGSIKEFNFGVTNFINEYKYRVSVNRSVI